MPVDPKVMELWQAILDVLRDVVLQLRKLTTSGLDVLVDYPFISDVKTIEEASVKPSYPNFENIFNALGYGSTSGIVQNLGPGNIFVVISNTPASEAGGSEIKVQPGQFLRWGIGFRPRVVRYLFLRTPVANTKYQVLAG